MRRNALFLLMALLVLSGCGRRLPTSVPRPADDSGMVEVGPDDILLTIAYSPEKEGWLDGDRESDIDGRIQAFNKSNVTLNGKRVVVQGINKSSGAARTEMLRGELRPTIWSPSASTWLEVLKEESGNDNIAVGETRPLVLTPVVISMWRPMAEVLGWPQKEIGWSDLLALIDEPEGWGKYGHREWGRFSWGHTDPEISTTALSTIIAELYAATGKTRGLTAADVKSQQAQEFLLRLGRGIKHYGYNTLVFSENMFKYGPTYISAFPMEEITLIEFNKRNPRTQLVAIYPKEGTFMHDDPYIVMSWAAPEQQQAAEKFYEFLLSEESQRQAMSFGFRPANPDVALADPLSAQFGVNPHEPRSGLEFPSAEVLVAAKAAWADTRKPANIMIVVDISGSMEGEKLDAVKAGLEAFLSKIPRQDSVGLVTFADEAHEVVPLGPRDDNLIMLQDQIQGMIANGGTAVYDGLYLGFERLIAADQPERINAIVLLSDGQDNRSTRTFEQLQSEFEESGISIFPIAYGEDSDQATLQQVADFSRTILVQGGTGDITTIFENMSRYF